MSKLLMLLMDQDYPFTTQFHVALPNQNVLVRQTISTPTHSRNTMLAKANFLKNLKNKYLVKVESLLQEHQTIHVMYEYIQSKLCHVLQSASTLVINKIYAQLHQFGRYLSNIGVRIIFTLDRMGFTEKETLKYFMGLDFEWEQDPDQEYLQQFYYKQVQEILGSYVNQNMYQYHQPQPSVSGVSIDKIEKIKSRKISHSTLPSRYNRFHKIDEKLKQIKSTPKIATVEHVDRNQSSARTVVKGNQIRTKQELPNNSKKNYQSRKYSGDVKMEMRSKGKLLQKQSDIRSQYNPKYKQDALTVKLQQPVKSTSDAGTSKTKTKIEEMKQKQYKQITNLNKQYTKDFLSVLEEDENQILNTDQDSPVLKIKKTLSQTEDIQVSADQLQQMAKEAMEHSMKVMHTFRTLLSYES